MPDEVLQPSTAAEATPAAAAVDPDTLSPEDYRQYRETGKAPEKQKSSATPETPVVETDSDSETDEEVQEQPKKKGGFQKRIDKLTKENAELQARLAGTPAEKKPEVKQTPAATPAAGDSKPQAKDFATYEDFTEALTDWKADQRDAAKAEKAKQEKLADEAKATTTRMQKQLEDARTRYEDFDEVALTDEYISQAVIAVLTTADDSADLAYYLGKNPAERDRINAMSPTAAAVALGRISAKFERAETPGEPKTKVSAAPAPIVPVGAKSAATSSKKPDEMSADEYRRARESGRLR